MWNITNLEKNKAKFREIRTQLFKAFDIWEKNVIKGREEDDKDVMNWYEQMLNYPNKITEETTQKHYPKIPDKIKKYL